MRRMDGREYRSPPASIIAWARVASLIGAKLHYLGLGQRHYWDPDRQREVSVDYESQHPVPDCIVGMPQVLIACHERPHVAALARLL